MKEYNKLRKELDLKEKVQKAIAEIRIARVKSLIYQYEAGMITASEYLKMTDNIWQDELNQANGRA